MATWVRKEFRDWISGKEGTKDMDFRMLSYQGFEV